MIQRAAIAPLSFRRGAGGEVAFYKYLIIILICLSACTKPDLQIILENVSDFARTDEPVVISRDTLLYMLGKIPADLVPVLRTIDGIEIPSQADDLDGDGQWDELFSLINFLPGQQLKIRIEFVNKEDVPAYPVRANVRFGDIHPPYKEISEYGRLKSTETEIGSQYFQMEGPAWENDKVAFRNYYDARNGMDIFGKRIADMVLDSVGVGTRKNYHELRDWGMDILKVGNSLGAGAIGIQRDDNIYRVGLCDTGSYKLLIDGPLRSIFRLTYEGCPAGQNSYHIVHEISIWGGSHFYKSVVTLSPSTGKEQLVTGIVNLQSENYTLTQTDGHTALITHANQAFDGELLGMGILASANDYLGIIEAPETGEGIVSTYVMIFKTTANPVVYYFYSGWEYQNPEFKQSEFFEDMIKADARRLNAPIKIACL
jgi:hypothetical protein